MRDQIERIWVHGIINVRKQWQINRLLSWLWRTLCGAIYVRRFVCFIYKHGSVARTLELDTVFRYVLQRFQHKLSMLVPLCKCEFLTFTYMYVYADVSTEQQIITTTREHVARKRPRNMQSCMVQPSRSIRYRRGMNTGRWYPSTKDEQISQRSFTWNNSLLKDKKNQHHWYT